MKHFYKSTLFPCLLMLILLANCTPKTLLFDPSVDFEVINTFTRSYENGDGTKTMEIFSYPIAFLDNDSKYKWIDNSIIETENEKIRAAGYNYQNKFNEIQIYFPNTLGQKKDIKIIGKDSYMMVTPLVNHSNAMVQEKQTIYDSQQKVLTYENVAENIDMLVYPTALGVKAQLNVKSQPSVDKIVFEIELSENFKMSSNYEYTQFMDQENETKVMIHQPFLRDSKKSDPYFLALDSAIIELQQNGNYLYTITLQNHKENIHYPIMMDITFHLHKSKQPDSSVKSHVSRNQYLGNLLFTGSNSDKGDMASYIRFEELNLKQIQSEKIISANYIAYELTKQSDRNTISAYQVMSNWGSPSISWAEQPIHSETRYAADIQGNQYTFDITEIVKTWYNIEDLEVASYQSRLGFVLKSDNTEKSYRVFASADNVWHSPKLQIVYRE